MTSELIENGNDADPNGDHAALPYLPPPVLPAAPPPAPVITPMPAADPFVATHQVASKAAADRARRAKRARRRGRIVILAAVVVLAAAAVVVSRMVRDDSDTPAPAALEPSATTQPVVDLATWSIVETPDFQFALPMEPTVESIPVEPGGDVVAANSWKVDTPKLYLEVVGINVSTPLDEPTAQPWIDTYLSTLANDLNGQIVLDEPFTDAGAWARHAVIHYDEGATVFVEVRAKASWVVSMMDATLRDTAPPVYATTVDSFTFK